MRTYSDQLPKAAKSLKRILVLDGDANHALACVRSLGRAGYTTCVASVYKWPLASWSRFAHSSFHFREYTLEAFASMRELVQRHQIGLVLPLTEKSCVLCNADRERWEELGIIIGCAPQTILDQAFDKHLTIERAKACDVRVPKTVLPMSLEDSHRAADEVGFPCIVKPRFSSRWNGKTFAPTLGCRYARNREELMGAVLSRKLGDDWPLVQELVPGSGKGVFAICNNGETVAWFAHERLRDMHPYGSGSSLRRSIRLDARLREPAARLLAELRWHGPAMVEFRDNGVNPPCLMEVNGRFWNSLQLAIDCGIDFPVLWVLLLTGGTVHCPRDYTDVTLRWFGGDVTRFLDVLSGPPAGFPGRYPTLWEAVKELCGPQPPGTRSEIWRTDDPWPALGEIGQRLRRVVRRLAGAKQTYQQQ
jgi:predicted ATP-grasp superfamily ATP-dependent carboligase